MNTSRPILPTTLAAAGDTPFSRYLYGGWEPGQPVRQRPVRMLVAIANPGNLQTDYQLQPIDVDQEWGAIQAAANHAGIHLELLSQPCTLAALVDKVAEGFHILHLVCHGAYSKRDGVPKLYLADKENQVQLVSDEEFAEALRNRLPAVSEEKRLRLVFLASCETATRSPADAFRGLAPKLVDAGVPVVLAMQDKVPVDTARSFAGAFYAKLLEHGRVDLACNQARAHVKTDKLPGSSIPVLFMRLHDGRLLEVRSKEELDYLTRVIQDFHELEGLYTPLAGKAEVAAKPAEPEQGQASRFRPASFWRLQEHGLSAERRVERVEVNDLRDAVRQYKRLVVLGEPGSGKTTTLWQLAYEYALEAQVNPNAPLPLLVELRKYNSSEDALAYVQSCFGPLKDRLPDFLNEGRVILLLDALNEMPNRIERLDRIQRLLDTYRATPVVVTCRTLDYGGELQLRNLEKLEIQDLDPIRQRLYVNRYLGALMGERLFWELAGQEVSKLWHTWEHAGGAWGQFWLTEEIPSEVARHISWAQRRQWDSLHRGELPPLLALGRNPFMLRLMVNIYEMEKGTLPASRGRLMAMFVDVLLEEQSGKLQREAGSWPGEEALKRSLARLAYAMQVTDHGKTAVDRQWAETALGGEVDAEQTLYLGASASLLEKPGAQVSFVHQLIQEYFAALALKERLAAGEDLRRYWPEGWVDPTGWEETCVLLAGIVPDMTPLVEQLLAANPPLAARCIAESGGSRPVRPSCRPCSSGWWSLMQTHAWQFRSATRQAWPSTIWAILGRAWGCGRMGCPTSIGCWCPTKTPRPGVGSSSTARERATHRA